MNTIQQTDATYLGTCKLFRIVTLKIGSARNILLHYYTTTERFNLCLVNDEPITNSDEFDNALFSITYDAQAPTSSEYTTRDNIVHILSYASCGFKEVSNMLSIRETLRRQDEPVLYRSILPPDVSVENISFTLDQTGKGWFIC
jgi:hypothetical protein